MGTLIMRQNNSSGTVIGSSSGYSFTAPPNVAYNGSNIISGLNGSKTLTCKDKMMKTNVTATAGSTTKTLTCKDKIMPYNVWMNYASSWSKTSKTDTRTRYCYNNCGPVNGHARSLGTNTVHDTNSSGTLTDYSISAVYTAALYTFCGHTTSYSMIMLGAKSSSGTSGSIKNGIKINSSGTASAIGDFSRNFYTSSTNYTPNERTWNNNYAMVIGGFTSITSTSATRYVMSVNNSGTVKSDWPDYPSGVSARADCCYVTLGTSLFVGANNVRNFCIMNSSGTWSTITFSTDVKPDPFTVGTKAVMASGYSLESKLYYVDSSATSSLNSIDTPAIFRDIFSAPILNNSYAVLCPRKTGTGSGSTNTNVYSLSSSMTLSNSIGNVAAQEASTGIASNFGASSNSVLFDRRDSRDIFTFG